MGDPRDEGRMLPGSRSAQKEPVGDGAQDPVPGPGPDGGGAHVPGGGHPTGAGRADTPAPLQPGTPAPDPGIARRMWHLVEPLHALVYYAPDVFAEMAALGYRTDERWPSYFPLRAAPLGEADAHRVTSAFYSFAPGMVAGHIDGAWRTASPADVLAARGRGIDRTYRGLLGERLDSPELAEAARLLREAAEAAPSAGRPLAAANASLPWPGEPHLQLWQASTVLREQRGDGHLAALLLAGLDPVESLVSFAAVGAASRARFDNRGWSAGQWAGAQDRLLRRGLVNPDGSATPSGHALRAEVERHTDVLALAPWQALGAEKTGRLADLLGEFWVAALSSGLLPGENTLGIGKV